MSNFDIDFSNFGAVNFDKQEVRIFKISDVTIWTKYYNPKYYIGRDFGPKQGELYPRNTVIPDRLKFIYDAHGTRHIVPSHHGEVFYLKQVIAIDGYDKTIESIDGSILCFNIEKTDCLDLNDENKTVTFPYRNFYSFYFNVLFEEKEGDIFINNIERDLYNFYPDNVLTAEAVALEGFEFDSWQLEQGPEIEPELLTQNPVSFVGPASDIQISAKFRPDRSQRPVRYLSIFNRTKDYGVIVDPFNGVYKQYDTVEISAQPRFGYFFKEWYSTDVVIEDNSAEKITFEMPDKNVSIYASFEPYSFDVTIEDNPDGVLSGGGTYKYKEQVQLTAEPINDDFVFDYWETEILGEKIKSANNIISLEMPAANVFARSFFKNNIFNLKVTNFSTINPETQEYQHNGGREISLSVNSPGLGFAFSGWNSKEIQIDTPMSESITFTMPAKNAELNYSYERRFPNLIIQTADYGGYATGGGKKVSGNNVVINATFEDGFEFERWEIVNNVEIPNFKSTDATSVFVMPINDVILKPIFSFITYNLVTSIIREDLSRELVSKLGGPNIPYKEGPGGFINLDKNKFQARENVVITNTAQEGFIFDHYTVSYGQTSYDVYDEDLVFAMPTYDVTITATFKEFLSTMTWDQLFTTAQIGAFFELKAETWSGQEIKYNIIQGDECLIGGENGNELFIGQKEEIEIEAYIEAGEIFPKESLRRTLSPEIVARTTISIKGPASGLKIDANRSVKGISNGQVNLPSNGYNVAGVAVTIDIYDDPSLVEYLRTDITSTQTLEDWYRLPLPDKFLKYELTPQYLSDENSNHEVVENGPDAKRLKFNTPVFPVSMSIEAKTQLAILWLADYTIYDVGDTAVAQASHNGADEAGNIIEFTFSIADETVASLDGSTITFLAQGATTITLDFAGNDNYSPQSITKDLIVKKDQVITWDQDLSQVIFGDSPLTLQATTDGPNPVEYSIYLTALGEINGQNLTLNNIEGNTVITALAPGNDFYKDAEVTKEINIYDENKDTDGDGIPDYLDEFPEQVSDSITWDQDLSLNAADSLELTAVSDSGSTVYYQFEDAVDSTIAEISGSTLSTTLAAEGETLKIKAYTVETSTYFSAENIRIMVVKVARDSDGDGVPDVTDPWAFQEDDSITWTQDLSAINAGSDITFTASSASGEAVLYRFSWNTQTPEPGSTYGSLNGTTFSADIGAEGLEIRVEAYTQASEGHFATSSIRTFTIIEPSTFSITISQPEISWDIGVDSEIFLENDGTLTVYGDNRYGELGMGDTSFYNHGKPNITSVKKVAMGQNHSLFLKQDGSVWAAGSNASGQLGVAGASRTTPTRIDALASNNIIDIEAGGASSFFITDNGRVYACGNNNRGQLGIDSYFNASTPTLVSGLTNISSVATSTNHTLFLRSDGTVWGSGTRTYRALGQSTITGEIYVPAQITRDIDGNPFDNVAAIAVSFGHSIFLKNDGTVWVCGYSNQGQLGTIYVGDYSQYPEQVTVGAPIQQIAAAANISILLDTNGQVWTAGANALNTYNIVGYLGVGSSNYREATFKKMLGTNVGSLTNIIKIQSSEWYGFGVLDQDGYLWWTGDRDPSTGGITTRSSQKWDDSIDLGLIHEINGTISTDLTTAKAGDIVTITTVPNSGYITSSITVKDGEGTTVPVTISGNTGTFSMPSSAVTVSALFYAEPIMTWDQDFSGVLAGQNIQLTATTNTGTEVLYRFKGSADYPFLTGHARIIKDGDDDYGNSLSGWWLSTLHGTTNVDYQIEAYTAAPENLSIVKVVNQGDVLDTDGDGIADVVDQYPTQSRSFSIVWDQDLSNILPGDSLVLSATATSDSIDYSDWIDYQIFDSSTGATISVSNNTSTLNVPSTETVGNTIKIRAYINESSYFFYAKLERSFDVAAPPDWDITADSAVQNGSIEVSKSHTSGWASSVTVLASDKLYIKTTPSAGYGVTDQDRLIKDCTSFDYGSSFSFIRESDGAVYSYGQGKGGIFGVYSYNVGEYSIAFSYGAGNSLTSMFFGDFMVHPDGSLATGFNKIFDASRWGDPDHCVLLHSDGTVWALGTNQEYSSSSSIIIDNNNTERFIFHPVKLKKSDGNYLTNVTEVFCAHGLIFALDSNGRLWSRGNNIFGQTTHDPANNPSLNPNNVNEKSEYIPWFQEVSLPAGLTVKEVAPGHRHSMILFTNGDVYSCGDYELLGYANTTQTANHNLTKILSNVSAVSAGRNHSLFLMNNGTVKATGYNDDRQLGRPINSYAFDEDDSYSSEEYTTDIIDVYSDANTPITGVDRIHAGNYSSFFTKGSDIYACGSPFELLMRYVELPAANLDSSYVHYASRMSISGNGRTSNGILYPDIDASQIKMPTGNNLLFLSNDKKKVYYYNYNESSQFKKPGSSCLFGHTGGEKYLMDLWFDAPVLESTTEFDLDGNPFRVASQAMMGNDDLDYISISEATTTDASFYFHYASSGNYSSDRIYGTDGTLKDYKATKKFFPA